MTERYSRWGDHEKIWAESTSFLFWAKESPSQTAVDSEMAVADIWVLGQESGGICHLFGSAYSSQWNMLRQKFTAEICRG